MLVPMQRYARIRATNVSGSSASSTSPRNVRFGSAFEATSRARSSSPLGERHARRAAPRRRSCASTSAPVRISAPASRAASAMASVRRPIPPRTNPHWRTPPPASSLAWSCRSTNAVPGGGRAGHAVVDRVPAERRLHVLGLEVLGQEPLRRGGEQVGQVGRVAGAGGSASRPHFANSRRSRQRAQRGVGRDPIERGDHPLHEPRQVGPRTARARRRRAARTASSPRRSSAMSSPRSYVRAVGEQVPGRARRVDADAAADQVDVAPDGLAEHREHVGAGRSPEAGRELLGVARAAHGCRGARAPPCGARLVPGRRR